jgi:FMN phosphatase YigB (HAD superfamily)
VLNSAAAVFLLDVDNTLLDNDRFTADLGERLEKCFGSAARARYWDIFARRRAALGLADYLGSLLEYPFASLLFPRALEAIAHLRTLGSPAVLSDGDIVFQPRKILHSGIWDAVYGRVMIYVHKEKVLDHMQRRFPASHYVMVDDKANLLAAMKSALGAQLTTVFVRQGHYALAAESNSVTPAPDLVIERIADLLNHNSTDFKVRP